MPKAIGNFSAINYGGSRILEFDFTSSLADGDSLDSLVDWSCTVASGTDANPSSRITTPPTTTGNRTQQKFIPPSTGTAWVVYILRADILTTNGEDLELWAYLAAGPAGQCAPDIGCGTC